MAEPIGALRALLSASAAVFEADMKKARDAVRTSGKDMEFSFKKIQEAGNSVIDRIFSMRTALAVLAGATGFYLASKRALDFAGDLADTAKAAGIAAESYQEMQYAAQLAGVDNDKFNTSLQKFNVLIGDAVNGNKAAVKLFQDLGISVKDLRSLSVEDLLYKTSKGIEGIDDSSRRAAIGADLFGKAAGSRMAQFLGEGTQALDDMRKQARDLGIVLSEETIKKAEETGDKMDALSSVIKIGLANALFETIPLWESLARGITSPEFTNAMRNITTLTQGMITIFSSLGGTLGDLVNEVDKIIEKYEIGLKLKETFSEDLGYTPVQFGGQGAKTENSMIYEQMKLIEDYKTGLKSLPKIEKINRTPTGNSDQEKENELLKEAKKVLEEIKTPLDKYNESISKLNQLKQIGYINTEQYNRALELEKEKLKDAERATNDLAETGKALADSLTDGITNLITSTDDWGDSLRSVGRNLINIGLQSVMKPIGENLGNIFTSLFDNFGGARAEGGRTFSGKTYLVGENGPELRSDLGSSQIVPNNQLTGMGGNTYNVYAEGADEGAVRRIESALLTLAGPGVVERRASDAMRRGIIK